MTKTQLLITGGIGALGIAVLVYLKKNTGAVVFGDEYGGAPPIDDADYFPREGENQPLPPFPMTLGLPISLPIGGLNALPPITIPADIQTPPAEAPEVEPVGSKGGGCTDVCNTCAGTSQRPFNGSGATYDFQKAARDVGKYFIGNA